MANPFFSGRIPPDLNTRIEEHCTETGESKTQLLINALSAYLNHPIKQQVPTNVSIDMFNQLEQRVLELENLLKTIVINNDNNTHIIDISNDNKSDNEIIIDDNYLITTDANDDSTSHERQIQLSVLEDSPSETLDEWIVSTVEVPNLSGLENTGLSRDQILTKLRNTKNSKNQSTKIGIYRLTFHGKEPGAKGSLLWKVIKRDNNDNS